MVHRCNGILLSHKKECISVSSNKVDEPTAYYAECRESEKEKQILYTNTYIGNLEDGTNKPVHRAAMKI